MSLILDALKRADAERQLGELPGLHVQQLTAQEPIARRWLRASSAVTIVVLAGALILAAIVWQPTATRTLLAAPAAPTLEHRPHTPVAATPPLITTAQVPVPPAVPKAVSTPTPTPTPTSTTSSTTSSPTTPAAPATSRLPAAPGSSNHSANPPRLTEASDTTRLPAPVANARGVASLTDLPLAIQQELPPFSITGSMHSTNPADRMLLIGNRMLREGDEVAPGLNIDTIFPKVATLRFKGYLFKVSH